MPQMNSLRTALSLLLVVLTMFSTKAQIFAPEGLNMPGNWNTFINPPDSASAFGGVQSPDGGLELITVGTRRYKTTFKADTASLDSIGTVSYLFTSGPLATPFANKWGGQLTQLDVLQTYSFGGSPDNGIVLTQDNWYTMNFLDAGYIDTEAIFMETSAEPVTIDTVYQSPDSLSVTINDDVTITVELSSAPSPEERFYLRYSPDGFTINYFKELQVAGTIGTATIPAFPVSNSITYYVFSTTVELDTSLINPAPTEYDMISINYGNNANFNFEYQVQAGAGQTLNVNLGADITVCGPTVSEVLRAGSFTNYLWSDGSTADTLLVTTPGTYAVRVDNGGLDFGLDTIVISNSNPMISLGSDVLECDTINLTLRAGPGFSSYEWLTGSTDSTRTATIEGLYAVTVTDALGCTATDDIIISGSEIGNLDLGPDQTACGGDTVRLDASTTAITLGDTLRILFDATGTVLAGSPKVYFYSGAELVPNGGFQFITGNFTQDDGIGQMSSAGADIWEIKFIPQHYYGYPAGTNINGILAVFTNADGSTEVKDNGNDIFINMTGTNPTTTFTPLSATYLPNQYTYLWSTGSTSPLFETSMSGTYTVTVTDAQGCTKSDAITISLGTGTTVDLGNDLLECGTVNTTLSAGPGYASYVWLDGSTDSTRQATVEGLYAVTVTDGAGCTASDEVIISASEIGAVDLGPDQTACGGDTIRIDATSSVITLGDTLRILFDAQGTALAGSPKVYFYSGAELVPLGGFQLITGNFGVDDGIGEMTPAGADIWEIRFVPQHYYGYPAGTNINGILAVFTNADGTTEVKDNGNDIFFDMTSTNPTTTFIPASATYLPNIYDYQWSTGSTSPLLDVSTSGTYTVTVTDAQGCSQSDDITIGVSSSSAMMVDLRNDVRLCDIPFTFPIKAGNQFATYLWSDGSTDSTLQATAEGSYSVTVSDANGCTSSDDVILTASQINDVDLGPDQTGCNGDTINLDASTSVVTLGDTLQVVFDAAGTALAGSPKVYFYSGAELVPLGGFQFITGNFGVDDGIGEMTSIGTDLWEIKFIPQHYYGYPAGTNINGILAVLTNADASIDVKDAGNDIFIDMAGIPTTTFAPLTVNFINNIYDYLWSDGSTSGQLEVIMGGSYAVTVTDDLGCFQIDTVDVTLSGGVSVNIGNDTTVCGPINLTLDAGTGLASYNWNDGTVGSSTIATQPGFYSVFVTDNNGCSATATRVITGSTFSGLDLGTDTALCPTQTYLLDAGVSITTVDDSLRIVYDATLGTSQLVGEDTVYFYSGAEITMFGGFQFVAGNYGVDNGIGRMTNIGTDLWEIVIHPQTYYQYPINANPLGIFMVFTNPDGTLTGKDDNDDDIYLDLSGAAPFSGFGGVTAQYLMPTLSYVWNDGSTGTQLLADTSGTYNVVVSDGNGCSESDAVNIFYSGVGTVDLGPDTSACDSIGLVLDPGIFVSYSWSDGSTAPTLTVTAAGTYSVDVVSANGCPASDTIVIGVSPAPDAGFTVSVSGSLAAFTSNAAPGESVSWDFDGDGVEDKTGGNTTFTFPASDAYLVTSIVINSCGSDTTTQLVNIVSVSNYELDNKWIVYPNPANEVITIDLTGLTEGGTLSIFDMAGKLVSEKAIAIPSVTQQEIYQLNAGLYYVQWQSEEGLAVKKLIVQ